MPHRDLKVLDAAEWAAVRMLQLIAKYAGRWPAVAQLQKSVLSIPLNIGEGFGRETRADRDYKLIVARAEAEETIKYLRTTFRAGRMSAADYWPAHHRYVAIHKRLDALIYS